MFVLFIRNCLMVILIAACLKALVLLLLVFFVLSFEMFVWMGVLGSRLGSTEFVFFSLSSISPSARELTACLLCHILLIFVSFVTLLPHGTTY